MKICLQEVISANVKVNNELISNIGRGYVLLVSFTNFDTDEIIKKMAEKVLKLRIWPDENGKTNLDLKSIDGEILSISQFTLYANASQGNRPSFVDCLRADLAKEMYEKFNAYLIELYPKVKTGIFHADMKVELINDGPFTLILDSKDLFK